MKKFILTLITLFLAFIIFYDFNKGTLTKQESEAVFQQKLEEPASDKPKETNKKNDVEYYEIEIEPGATVISVTEKLYDGPLPVSIEVLIKDFKELNPNVAPEKIQIGETYKFPNYAKD